MLQPPPETLIAPLAVEPPMDVSTPLAPPSGAVMASGLTPPFFPVATAQPKFEPVKSIAGPDRERRPNRRIETSSHREAGRRGTSFADDGRGGGGSGFSPPKFRLRYWPRYPAEARAQRLEGTVLLRVEVDASGRVTSASVQQSCGHPVLDRAALASVRSWRFDPASRDGVAIAAQVEVPVRFRFEQGRTTQKPGRAASPVSQPVTIAGSGRVSIYLTDSRYSEIAPV